jgi:hypothetical protein
MIKLRVTGLPNGGDNVPLSYVAPSRADVLDASQGGSGISRHYTILAGRIVIVPQRWAPIGGTLELTFYKFVPLAQADGGANWLLQKYPQIYLYGSLMQAAAYVDDKETVAFWKSGRDEAMAKLQRTARKRKLGGASLTMSNSTGFRT